MEVKNRFVSINKSIYGSPTLLDFDIGETLLTLSVKYGSRETIVKNIVLPIDPGQLNRMKSSSPSQTTAIQAASTVAPGQVIGVYGLGQVVASGDPDYEPEDKVVGLPPWQEYSVISAAQVLRKLSKKDVTAFPLTYHVDMLKEELGFDDAFNYNEEIDLKSALKRYFPNVIDIYFDNVGGPMLEGAVENMNSNGRIAACGVISEYSNTTRRSGLNMIDVIYERITIKGFISIDQLQEFPEFISTMSGFVRSGKVRMLEDVSGGIETVPSTFVMLFEGANAGKKLVKLE